MSTGSVLDVDVQFGMPLVGAQNQARDALGALRGGGFVMLCDDESRDGRYDLVARAESMTTAQAAFLIRHSSGFLQVAMRDERCDRLRLPPVAPGCDRLTSQQCVGVDAAVGVGTGISAADRARTISLLGRSETTFADFTRPGHVLPVRVAPGPTTHDPAQFALTMVETAGSAAAVFATVIGTGPYDTGLLTRSAAREFAAAHGIPLIGHETHSALVRGT